MDVAACVAEWDAAAVIAAVTVPETGLQLSSDVYLVDLVDGRRVVVHGDKSRVEPDVQQYVRQETSLPVPSVVYTGDGFYIETGMPGAVLHDRFVGLERAVQGHVLQDVGRLLGELHTRTRFNQPGYLGDGLSVTGPATWSAVVQELVREELAGIRETRFRDLVPVLQPLVEQCAGLPDAAVLLHNDVGPSNLLAEDGRVSGVVDWGNALVGHGEYDLFRAERSFLDKRVQDVELRDWLRQRLYAGYQEFVGLREGWKRRRVLYRLVSSLEVLRLFPVWSASLPEPVRMEEERFWRGLVERLCGEMPGI